MAVGQGGIGRGFTWQRAGLWYDLNALSLKPEGVQISACGRGSFLCFLFCRVLGVSVGGDLQWDSTPFPS